jgi:site-specific DNA-methyltransferase (adenine-specific)
MPAGKEMRHMGSVQPSLFSDENNVLSISETATVMNVSEASVRNWIKTGYLRTDKRNLVLRSSFEEFQNNVAGQEKLTTRANKSKLDNHDHASLISLIEDLIQGSMQSGERISDLYESSLSQSHRNLEGVYYTPSAICESFFAQLPSDRDNLVFLDPCCGTGNFLVAAIKAGIRPENVMGCDIDGAALSIAHKRLQEASGGSPSAGLLVHNDFLSLPNTSNFFERKPNVIFTNPPWGKKIDNPKRELLAKQLSCKRTLDTSGLFLLACRNLIREGGYYGMLLPESFFNVSAFEHTRSKILEDELIKLEDHGKAFPGLLTKAISFSARRKKSSESSLVRCTTSQYEVDREQTTFSRNPSKILNYWASRSEVDLLNYVFELPHKTLTGRAKWALGVVTGNNKRHLSDHPREGFVPVYRGADINTGSLNAPSNFISEDMSGFQQVAPREMYYAPEKIIYRFISSRLVFYHDTEQCMILNSANLLIPGRDFDISMPMIAQYFSSDFVNWLYSRIFATHKVLRSDIERLPIFVEAIKDMKSFDEEILLKNIGVERNDDGSYRVKK